MQNADSPSDTRPLLFCATATDGPTNPWLPDGRRIWEIAAIRREADGTEEQFTAYIRLEDLPFESEVPGEARQTALEASGFYERHPQIIGDKLPFAHEDVSGYHEAATVINRLTVGRPILVGSEPSFDAEGLLQLLHGYGLLRSGATAAPWEDRLVSVWALVAGRLGRDIATLDRDTVAAYLGVSATHSETALDAAIWARDVYDAVMGHAAAEDHALFDRQTALVVDIESS